MIRNLLIYISAILLLTACHKHHEEEAWMPQRTVLVYMAGENNLSYNVLYDLREMMAASIDPTNDCLLVYVDRAKKEELPYLARIKDGKLTDSVSVADMNISQEDPYTSDPRVMEGVMRYAFNKYRSADSDYGLVLWGHASGWLPGDSITTNAARETGRRKAFGGDTGNNTMVSAGKYWMNMYTLAQVLSRLPHLRFIFADCCHFQCLESAYELRNVADYIIGSPAEIPNVGAPYTTVVPALFEKTTFYTSVVNRYYEQVIDSVKYVPLSVIKTEGMDQLAAATRQVLLSMADTLGATPYPNLKGLIHYYVNPRFPDANDFVRHYATAEAYSTWKQALDQVVVYKKMAMRWATNRMWSLYYKDFTMTEEGYGGVSMYVPQDPAKETDDNYNKAIRNTSWYEAVGLSDLGW